WHVHSFRFVTISPYFSGKPQSKSRTHIQLAYHREIASHRPSEPATDGKSESTTLLRPCQSHVCLYKGLENRFELVFRDATTGIGHANADIKSSGEEDCSFGRRSDFGVNGNSSAGTRAFDRV